MVGKIKTQRKRNRKKGDPNFPVPPSTINVLGVVHGSSQVTVHLAAPVQIAPAAFPSTWTFAGHAVTAVVSSAGNFIVLAVGGTVAASDPYVIAALDPAVRTPSGGYVAGSSGLMT